MKSAEEWAENAIKQITQFAMLDANAKRPDGSVHSNDLQAILTNVIGQAQADARQPATAMTDAIAKAIEALERAGGWIPDMSPDKHAVRTALALLRQPSPTMMPDAKVIEAVARRILALAFGHNGDEYNQGWHDIVDDSLSCDAFRKWLGGLGERTLPPKVRGACCSVGYGGPYEIAKYGLEPGCKHPYHISWLPNGYAPTHDDYIICLVACPPKENWDHFGLAKGERPPLIEAICSAIEKHARHSMLANIKTEG